MKSRTPISDDLNTCVFEAPRGGAPSRARDCSDEFLPEGEQIDDEERKRVRENRVFKPDWSLSEKE